MDDLIAFNKPCGVICQFSEHEKHPCLKDYVDRPGFYPAGRLDTDSEGLLLLTERDGFGRFRYPSGQSKIVGNGGGGYFMAAQPASSQAQDRTGFLAGNPNH